MHSNRSDGQELPAHVAAACRRIGLDLMALTDHRKYEPSLEAMRAFQSVDLDLCIYPGEEVHPPDNRVHIVNFGGSFSINELFTRKQAYLDQVCAIEQRLTNLPAGALRYQYASCIWCYEKIREGGGIAIFCHPYWMEGARYNVPEALIARHLEDLPFDAFELIGGYQLGEIESNVLQVARYQEERARGRQIPIVGSSDSHGCECGTLFGWYYSIVFAPSAELADIKNAIRSLRSVAIEALPGHPPRIHGPFRLVKYAHFLEREVLPLHDALCAKEGELMQAHFAGSPNAAAQLHALQGQTRRLYQKLWGTP
jgi:hypothetical protein